MITLYGGLILLYEIKVKTAWFLVLSFFKRGINNIKDIFDAQTLECVSNPKQNKKIKVANPHKHVIEQV